MAEGDEGFRPDRRIAVQMIVLREALEIHDIGHDRVPSSLSLRPA
jgi:hypothetical protein